MRKLPLSVCVWLAGFVPGLFGATQQAYLKASNTGGLDNFGYAVAVSGDTMVVGAPGEDSPATGVGGTQLDDSGTAQSGAVYVFTRTGTVWSQQAYLKASNTGLGDNFGDAVAISGDTLVVGAPYEDSPATGVDGSDGDDAAQSGAAYVFVRNGTTWSQQAYLKASNTGLGDNFGRSVAVSGDTVVVGAHLEDSPATGVNGSQGDSGATVNSGAAYVFHRSGTSWSQQAYLKASNTGSYDYFGCSVAISGDTVLVGAYGEDGPGDLISGLQAGAAYVFQRSGTTWSQQAYLKASNAGQGDDFGWSVAISGDSAVIGAIYESSAATGVNGDGSNNDLYTSGAAYVFQRSGTAWSQQAYLKASNTGFQDFFGYSVAISGGVVIVGAPQESSAATGIDGTQNNDDAPYAGAAYAYVRRGTAWSQDAYLKASNTDINDVFGYAVAAAGGTVVAGAYGEDSAATGVDGNQDGNGADAAGAAYAFVGFSIPIVITDSSLTGSTFTIGFTGESEATGWKVKGSADLNGFPDDLTALTTITETSPGIYQALVDVSGKPDRYFLRIER